MSECKGPAAGQSFKSSQDKSMNRKGLVSDWTQSEWQQIDFLEFMTTTIDPRIVLFQAEEPSFLAN